MKISKPVILAFVYAVLFSALVSFVFYGDHIKYIGKAYFLGLLGMLPFVYAAVWFQRRDIHEGEIGGKEAGKEGIKFVVIATLFLIVFQIIFFETSFREYKVNYMQTVGPEMLKQEIAAGKIKITEAEIPKIIAADVAGVTLFKEVTSVIFKTVFYGVFCSLISAVLLRRKN